MYVIQRIPGTMSTYCKNTKSRMKYAIPPNRSTPTATQT